MRGEPSAIERWLLVNGCFFPSPLLQAFFFSPSLVTFDSPRFALGSAKKARLLYRREWQRERGLQSSRSDSAPPIRWNRIYSAISVPSTRETSLRASRLVPRVREYPRCISDQASFFWYWYAAWWDVPSLYFLDRCVVWFHAIFVDFQWRWWLCKLRKYWYSDIRGATYLILTSFYWEFCL